MSRCDNKDELLQQLAENAKPVDVASFSENPGIYGFFLLKGYLCIRRQKVELENGTLLYLGKTESSQKARDAVSIWPMEEPDIRRFADLWVRFCVRT